MIEMDLRLRPGLVLAAFAWIAGGCDQDPPAEGAETEVAHFNQGTGVCRQVTHRDPGGQFGPLDLPGSEEGPCQIPPDELCSTCTGMLPIGVSNVLVGSIDDYYYRLAGECVVGVEEANTCTGVAGGDYTPLMPSVPDATIAGRPVPVPGTQLLDVGVFQYSESTYELSDDGLSVSLSYCNNYYSDATAWPNSLAADPFPCQDASRCFGCLSGVGRSAETVLYATPDLPCEEVAMTVLCSPEHERIEY